LLKQILQVDTLPTLANAQGDAALAKLQCRSVEPHTDREEHP
jgi:hypothetical protein